MPQLRERPRVISASPNGVLGDPTGAWAAHGRRLLAKMERQLRRDFAQWVVGDDGTLVGPRRGRDRGWERKADGSFHSVRHLDKLIASRWLQCGGDASAPRPSTGLALSAGAWWPILRARYA